MKRLFVIAFTFMFVLVACSTNTIPIIQSESLSESLEDVNPPAISTNIQEDSITHSDAPVAAQDPFSLMGDGQGGTGVALMVVDSSSGITLELDRTKGSELLSKIDFSKFTIADMVQEITPPDAADDGVGTQGNHIKIGMLHTNILYIYETQTQALLVGSETKYLDIPPDMYSTIKSILDEK